MTNELRTTYLLAWNPKNFAWDRLDQEIGEVAEKGELSSWWSTGSVRNIPLGSRVFLIRLGVDPRGIVGSGFTTGEVSNQEHWQPERRAAGDRVNRVPIRFDVLVRLPLIRRAELEGKQFGGYNWDTQMSGVRIPPEVAQELELVWSQRVEGAKRGEALPAILPNDVDRWRTYLLAADEDPEYVERHRLRDKRRMEVSPALKKLVEAFTSGQTSLAEFKEQFDSKTRVEWEVLGLKGPAGAMFLNQVAKNVPDHEVAERIMRSSVKVPVSIDDARTKIDEVVQFLDQQVESGGVASNALRSANARFFLSACWNAQGSEKWPTFFQSARKALQEDGLLSRQLRGGDGYVAFVNVFGSLAKALGVSFLTLEHLCDRLHSGEARSVGVGDDSEEGEEQEPQSDRPRVWLVAPGPRAQMFDEFYKEGVMGLGGRRSETFLSMVT